MTLNDYFKRDEERGLWSMESLTLMYMLFTTILIGFYWEGLAAPMDMLLTRLWMLVAMAAVYGFYRWYPCRALRILRVIPPLLGLIFWYPETYDFCSQLPYLDHIFAGIDQTLFGCQPALVFNTVVTSTFWSEAFNMGYYAYYYMMGATIIFYLLCRYAEADKAGFIFLTSFFLFYVIYELLPVAGPQYYFKAVGVETANTGVFPDVGYYFQSHTEMLMPEIKGIFSRLVLGAQEVGERPTAAFPSSHVGMSTVTMLLAWRTRNKWLFWGMMPFYLLLCCATVYIQAHYLIDSICGFLVAFVFYGLTSWLYDLLKTDWAALSQRLDKS
ncbi:MAG: phosphatase PAP2 family protein [Bacteroidaceae bacterium]|nr:phosphatase PAP2 family protein [Bacteroidaceae bacterium]MDE5739998.1 phosphatase PAP2 family protein [Bacteroidaceae bacterium]